MAPSCGWAPENVPLYPPLWMALSVLVLEMYIPLDQCFSTFDFKTLPLPNIIFNGLL